MSIVRNIQVIVHVIKSPKYIPVQWSPSIKSPSTEAIPSPKATYCTDAAKGLNLPAMALTIPPRPKPFQYSLNFLAMAYTFLPWP